VAREREVWMVLSKYGRYIRIVFIIFHRARVGNLKTSSNILCRKLRTVIRAFCGCVRCFLANWESTSSSPVHLPALWPSYYTFVDVIKRFMKYIERRSGRSTLEAGAHEIQ